MFKIFQTDALGAVSSALCLKRCNQNLPRAKILQSKPYSPIENLKFLMPGNLNGQGQGHVYCCLQLGEGVLTRVFPTNFRGESLSVFHNERLG